jgi:hypothetical protein
LFFKHFKYISGIKSVALSYSRISLADVADKLQLDSPEDAEYIIAKVRICIKRSKYDQEMLN